MADRVPVPDRNNLRGVLYKYGRLPPGAFHPRTSPHYIYDPVWQALQDAGVHGWLTHFVNLSDDDLDRLEARRPDPTTGAPRGPVVPLTIAERALLRILKAWFHHMSRELDIRVSHHLASRRVRRLSRPNLRSVEAHHPLWFHDTCHKHDYS